MDSKRSITLLGSPPLMSLSSLFSRCPSLVPCGLLGPWRAHSSVFSPLPGRPRPPVCNLLSPPPASPTPVPPRLPLPSSFLCTAGRISYMTVNGSLDAAGCLWPPATAILLASCPSCSNTSRMSATTDAPSPSLSAWLSWSALGLVASRHPAPSPYPPAPAASTAAAPRFPASCPPLAPPSPLFDVAAHSYPCFLALRPSCGTVSDSLETGATTSRWMTPSASMRGTAGVERPAYGPR